MVWVEGTSKDDLVQPLPTMSRDIFNESRLKAPVRSRAIHAVAKPLQLSQESFIHVLLLLGGPKHALPQCPSTPCPHHKEPVWVSPASRAIPHCSSTLAVAAGGCHTQSSGCPNSHPQLPPCEGRSTPLLCSLVVRHPLHTSLCPSHCNHSSLLRGLGVPAPKGTTGCPPGPGTGRVPSAQCSPPSSPQPNLQPR